MPPTPFLSLLCSIVIICIIACNTHEVPFEKRAATETTRDEVTLIFDTSPLTNQGDTFLLGRVFDTIHLQVQYIDEYYRSIRRAVNGGEVITIPIQRDFFEFGLGVIRPGPGKYHYEVEKGDSVFISTQTGTPYATILNRDFDSTSLNASYYLSRPEDDNFTDGMDFYFERDSEKRKARINEYRAHFARRKNLLDSLFANGAVDENAYTLQNKIIDGTEITFEMWLRHNNKGISLEETTPYDPIQVLSEKIDFNDSSVLFSPIIQSIFGQYLIGGLVNYQRNEEKETQYTLAYDSIQKYPGLPRFQKEYLMALCIYRMTMLESTPVVNEYIEKYITFSNNSALKEFIMSNYLVELNFLKERKDSLMLISSSGKQINNFMEIVKNIETEYAYIDLWASWCKPCIAAMPASQVLRKKYKDKVTFLYLSVDKEMDPWEQASLRHDLMYYENNYLLLNPENAAVFRDLKINTIPRYMLVNNQGQIIDSNSPSPIHESEIESYFNSLR